MDDIRRALAMPWGGERNLALRAALGLVEGEIGMVNQGDVAQVVVDSHARASQIARRLKLSVGADWNVATTVRPDGRHLVTAAARLGVT